MCKSDYFMTMVTIGFKLQPNPRRNRPWKAKYIQQNASTDNARLQWRSLSHVVLKQNIHHFFCVAKFIYNLKQIVLKSGKALFQCFHVTVLQYYIPMKEVNHFLNNITLIQPNYLQRLLYFHGKGNLGVLGCGNSGTARKQNLSGTVLAWYCVNHTNSWIIK